MTKIIGVLVAVAMAISAAPVPAGTIPDSGGYEYTISLSEGRHPETDAFSGDGEGAFAILYENGKLTGCGDASLFGSTLSCDGTTYTVSMGFYQNEGLFFSGKLRELLNSMCYLQYGETLAEPEEKYTFIDENVSIIINGHKAERIKVTQWRGNGHVDFGFEIANIPMYQKNEIERIYFSVGDTEGLKQYDIVFRETGLG